MQQPGLARFYSHPSAAWLVLATGFVLSAAAAFLLAGQVEREARLKFDSAASDAKVAIESRINAYADVLLGVRGLFISDNSVNRVEFKRYIDSLDLNRRYPGIQVIHYSRRISAAERPAFEAMVRGDTSVEPRGYPDFAIRPAGNRPEYVVAQFVEPMAGNERALGLDLGGDAVRLAALRHTRESAQLTASGTIALANIPERHPGFAMRLAVYQKDAPLATVAQRRDAFNGVVSASFIVIDLMRGVLSQPFLQKMHVRIHDAGFLGGAEGLQSPTGENMMFDSDRLLGKAPAAGGPWGDRPASLRSVSDLDVGGRRWHLYFSARQELGAPVDRWLPWLVLLGGLTVSLLLFGLIRTLATTGTRAVELANRITENLRRSEAKLAETQRMTQQLIEVLPNPIYFKDTGGRYLGANKAWENFFSTPRSAFVGKTVHELYPGNAEIADRLYANDQALWDRPGTPQVYETAITTPDGQHHDVIYYKATFTRADGGVAGLIGTIVDITERKRAEEGLRASEETLRAINQQLQMLVQSSPLAIYTRDEDGLLTSWNPAAEKMYGWKASEVLGRRLPSVPGEARAESDGLRMRLLAGEPFIKHEARRIRRDGSSIEIDASLGPLRDVNGNVTGIIAVVTDITQRKQLEQRQAMEHKVTRLLAESASLEDVMPKLLQTICEALGCACGARRIWDEREQKITCGETWNESSAEVEQFLGLSREPRVLPQSSGGLLRRVLASGEPTWISDMAGDTSFRRGPEALRAGLRSAFAFPIRFGNEILGVMEFFSRESHQPDEALVQSTRAIGSQIGQFMARRQAEEALRGMNVGLERRVAERTAALESAYRELESFSYSVSHDLRAPLGVIASFAGVLSRQEAGRISEDGIRILSLIDVNAQRMGRLIDALLELMRVSRRALARKELDMAAIAGKACEELGRSYPQARIELGALPAAQGDAMLVSQVYANLVGNALKFSSRTASPRVEVGAEARDGAAVYFVRDNGAGFKMDHSGKLFKPFERLHTEAEFEGTGIGLALVHLIVQRHGGRIWAEGAPGRGATFRFTLGGRAPD
jgi:PAS domain S-box-containing protein